MQQPETSIEMGDRFEVGQSRRGMLPRLQPLLDRTFGVVRSRQVVGEQLGLPLGEIGEMLFQRRRDARSTCRRPRNRSSRSRPAPARA